MIISFHDSDEIPADVLRLNEQRGALDAFESCVNQENSSEYTQFSVNDDEFLAGWSAWTDEMQSAQFLFSTTITYRMKHIMGSLCAHLCKREIVIAEQEVDYLADRSVRFRRNFIAGHCSLYFAVYFCWLNYNLTLRTVPAQSQKPGIDGLKTLFDRYRGDPEQARSVISHLHSFVSLQVVR